MTLGTKLAWDDTVLPFQLDRSNIRGRVARLDGVLDGILKQHDYPAPVEALVAEMALLTALIGQTMKLRWKLSLQVQSKGHLSMTRRFGPPPEPGRRYTHRAGAYAILVRGRDLLATWQSAPQPELQLPGGGIDPGESPLQALHREVFEETGWTIAAPRRLGAFRRFVYMPEYDMWAEKLCTIYLARPVMQLGTPLEAGHEAVWLAPEIAATALGNEGDRSFVERYLAGAPYSRSAAETSSLSRD